LDDGRSVRRVVRALLRLAAGLLAGLALLFVAGAVTPWLLVGDGLADLPVEMRPVGEAALRETWGGCSEPIDRVLNRQLRVVRIEPVPGRCPTLGGGVGSRYRVLVQRHTFFGIAFGTIAVCGSGGECWARAE
jgi:hypothetical protein